MAQRLAGRKEIYDVDEDFDGVVLETSIAADEQFAMEKPAAATRGTNEAMNQQPTLPNGQIIDSKNTLQSFKVPFLNEVPRQAVPIAISNVAAATNAHHTDNNNEIMNQPRLPSGRVIDSKNTLQSFPVPIPTAFAVASSSNIANAAEVTRPNNNDNNAVQASSIVEGVLVVNDENPSRSGRTKSFWWWVLITLLLVMVCALVVTGVCASGKCSAAKSDPAVAQSGGLSMLTPESTLVERAVSAFINNITYSEEEIVVNGTNPESHALTWLIYGDDIFTTSQLLTLNVETETEISFRVRQRYALATLWFQQVDESGDFLSIWHNTTGWLDYSNECEWYGIDCESMDLRGNVGLQEVVTKIDFYDPVSDSGNALFGTFPPDIGQLTLLTYLDFRSPLFLAQFSTATSMGLIIAQWVEHFHLRLAN